MKRKNEETPVNGVEENVVGEEAQAKTPEVSENTSDAEETPAIPQNATDEQPSQEEKPTGKTGKRGTKSKTPEVSENTSDAEETPAIPQNATDEQPSQEEKPTGKTGKRGTKSKTPEVSEAVDAVLKKFPQYDELYVDAVGGVYIKDSQPSLVEGAILYQNPYYNK